MNRRNFNKLLSFSPLIMTEQVVANNLVIKSKKVLPKALKKGDKVALITPAGPINKEKFGNAIKNLENLGLVPSYEEKAFAKTGYLAGDDDARTKELHQAFGDKSIKAIWCLRGGYGTSRIIANLDYKLIKKNPKILIGYSDITALLLAIYERTGLVGFHGPVAISEEFSAFTFQQVQSILFGSHNLPHQIPFQRQSDEKYAVGHEPYTIHPGKAKGELTGGNLSLLVCLPNTKFQPTYKNKIVFIEDVGEKPYRIDRMLTYLLDATDLKDAAGIVLGVFSDCDVTDTSSSFTLRDVLIDRLAALNIPCFYGHTFGHVRDIATFPIGIDAFIDTDTMAVSLLERAVDV